MNLSKIKKLFTKRYSFNLIFLMKNRFQDEKVRISSKKWTSKFENALFLSAHQYSNLQDINFFSEYVDFHAKIYWILRGTCLISVNGLALL